MPLQSAILSGNPRLESVLSGGPPVKPAPPYDDPDAVGRLQRALVILLNRNLLRSFDASGTPDGKYGHETYQAVLDFQQSVFPNQSGEWDGRVGKKTLSEMDARLPANAPVVPPAPPPAPSPPPSPAPFIDRVYGLLPRALARQASAVALLDLARIAIDFSNTNDFNKAALNLVNRCFKIFEANEFFQSWNKSDWKEDIENIKKVYAEGNTMFTTAIASHSYIIELGTFPSHPDWNAFCHAGTWVKRDPTEGIWVIKDRCTSHTDDWILDLLTHECAHFCGPSGADKIDDLGYGDAALLLPRAKAQKNAANYAWFAGLSQTSKENWPNGTYPS